MTVNVIGSGTILPGSGFGFIRRAVWSDIRLALFEGSIYSNSGKPLGKYRAFRRHPTKREQAWIAKNLLEPIDRLFVKAKTESEGEKMAKSGATFRNKPQQSEKPKEERCNMVFLAGPIASRIGTYEDKNAMFLIDSGPDKKFIKCTIHDERELVRQVEEYEKGDYIKLVGFVRIWGKKIDDEWIDTWEIRVTEIKSKPPERAKDFPARNNGSQITDDDIPF